MRRNFAYAGLLAIALCILTMLPIHAQAAQCSQASGAGSWAYTYTGTVFTPAPYPVAAVGHFHQDFVGNVSGGQTHTLAGQTEAEDISGTATVNHDCTGSATIRVLVNGQLLRTATLDLVYDSDGNHVRMIFTSLVLADGTQVPAVITVDGHRLVSRQ